MTERVALPPYSGNQELDVWMADITDALTNLNTGAITATTGVETFLVEDTNTGTIMLNDEIYGYRYDNLAIKYATSSNGSENFSDSIAVLPVGTTTFYVGFRSTDSELESNNPADYTWVQASPTWNADLRLFYRVTGGRQFDYRIALTNPNPNLYSVDEGEFINLILVVGQTQPVTSREVNVNVGTGEVFLHGRLISYLYRYVHTAFGSDASGTNFTRDPQSDSLDIQVYEQATTEAGDVDIFVGDVQDDNVTEGGIAGTGADFRMTIWNAASDGTRVNRADIDETGGIPVGSMLRFAGDDTLIAEVTGFRTSGTQAVVGLDSSVGTGWSGTPQNDVDDGDTIDILNNVAPSEIFIGLKNDNSETASNTASEYIWEEHDWGADWIAMARAAGGHQFEVFTDSELRADSLEITSTVDTFDLDTLTALDYIPVPSALTNVTATMVDFNATIISWEAPAVDADEKGLTFIVEQENDGTWREVATVAYPAQSYVVNGLANVDTDQFYRITPVNVNGEKGPVSSEVTVAPPDPMTPIEWQFQRETADIGVFTWSMAEDEMVRIKHFVIESRTGTNAFRPVTTLDGTETSFRIYSLQTENVASSWRIKAVSFADKSSGYAPIVMIDVPTVDNITNFSATPVELVGVLTTVELSWSYPIAVNYVSGLVTVQFRPVGANAEWRDVIVVHHPETSVEILPPQQGEIEFRIRLTSTAGVHSDWVESGPIFASGGSATDSAIYGADGAFISQNHYSVNADDFTFTSAKAADAIISGGAYDSTEQHVKGDTDSELLIDWIVVVPTNAVNRNRHYYLDVPFVEGMGTAPSNFWNLDDGTIHVEVLTDPATTENFYFDEDGTDDADSEFVYRTADGADADDTRSFAARAGDFMYATRTYVRLPMRKTFTFREAGSTCVRLRFEAINGGYPVVSTASDSEMMLQAFSTEVVETRLVENVTSTGTAITFNKDFEAAPCVFLTPRANTNAYVTSVSSTGCTVHVGTSSQTDVDMTVRGY